MSNEISNKVTQKNKCLPEKYSKFIQFGYFMMNLLKNKNKNTFTEDEFLNELQIFNSNEEQQSLIESFLNDKNNIKKNMNKNIKEYNESIIKTNNTNISDNNIEDKSTDINSTSNELQEEQFIVENINNAVELAKSITAKKPRKKPTPKKLTKKLEKEWKSLVTSTPPVYNPDPSALSTHIYNILTAKNNGENVTHLIIELLENQKNKQDMSSSLPSTTS
tara:strand:- start:10393 stop:11052 length:660 start_codon:yes stop_codon:yes gene_type:complete